MKKNRMCRLASALLILVLLTTSVVGSTFAKYTTEGTASDTARVAKWGVDVSVSSDLFAEEYNGTATGYTGKVTVKAGTADKKNLVAPGTTGKGLSVKNAADSEPEVSYSMTIKLDENTAVMPSLKYKPTDGNEATYEPVKFNVYNGDTKLNADALTLDGLKTLFKAGRIIYTFDVSSGNYTVDTNLDGDFADETATGTEPDIKVEWVWEYENATEATRILNDKLDTVLGNAAVTPVAAGSTVNYEGGTAKDVVTAVKLDWTITATQID